MPRSAAGSRGLRVTPTDYRDCYCGQADGHEFVLANAWTSIVELHTVSVCQVRLGWFLSEPVWIEPARFASIMAFARQIATGDPAFDRQFRVHAAHQETVAELLSPDVRALLTARDDWFWTVGGTDLLCVCRDGYHSPDDLRARLAEVCGIAAAFPSPAAQSAAAKPILLSSGVVFDPADIEGWKAALAAQPPDQRQQTMAELKARLAERRLSASFARPGTAAELGEDQPVFGGRWNQGDQVTR